MVPVGPDLGSNSVCDDKSATGKKSLTLKAPITTAADDKFCDIFPNFEKKTKV